MDNLSYDDKAKMMYERHLERMRNYSKNHKEKTRETSKKAYQQIKQDPEKYKLYLEKRKKQYHARKTKKILEAPLVSVPDQIIENEKDKIDEIDEIDEIEYKDFTIE